MSLKDFEKLNPDGQEKKDEAINYLEEKTEYLQDKIQEERFCWVFFSIILMDIYVFSRMDTWAGPISITFLEVIFLALLGKRYGVEEIVGIIGRIIDHVGWLKRK